MSANRQAGRRRWVRTALIAVLWLLLMLDAGLFGLLTFGRAAAPNAWKTPFAGESASYELMLDALPCGTFTVRVRQQVQDGRPRLMAEFQGQTSPAIALLYSLRAQGVTCMDPQTLRPAWSTLLTVKKDKTKLATTKFDLAGGVVLSEVERLDKRRRQTHRIAVANAWDPASALMRVRTLRPAQGDAVGLTVVEVDNVYDVRVRAVGAETVTVRGKTYGTRVLEARMTRKLREGDEPADEELSPVRVWLTDDAQSLPVKLECKLKLGTVTAELLPAGGTSADKNLEGKSGQSPLSAREAPK